VVGIEETGRPAHRPRGKRANRIAMRVKEDRRVHPPGGDTAAFLARQLSDAVRDGNGANGGNGNGSERARRIALEAGVAMLAETSGGTAEHSSDVVLITEAIGERMGIRGVEAADLLAAARLHDIGKAWIPPEVLEKPGPLNDREWELMHQHTLVGERILSSVEEFRGVARLVRNSHERWDGGGYPDGIAGTEIPLGSRIIFCADTFHAIRCDRPYRAGRSAREALAEVKRCAGTQFDPKVARALEQVVFERNRRPRAGGGSTRLFALLMCLGVLGAGSAIARSGLLHEPPAPSHSAPPPGCGTAACPTVAGPVGGLAAVGGPGPRPLNPGQPGEQHRAGKGHNHQGGKNGKSAEAKHHQKAKGHAYGKAKGAGHSAESHGNGGSGTAGHSSAPGSSAPRSGGSSGGSGHASGGGHHSGSRNGSRGHPHSNAAASHGNAGGNPAHGK
jgi:HD domain-containing protein